MKKRILNLIVLMILMIPVVSFLSSCDYLNNLLNQEPEVVTYTVTFNSTGGSDVAPITGVESGSTIEKPENPTKENYRFYAWYLNNYQWKFGFDVVTEDINLVARWVRTYTVIFDSDGADEIENLVVDENSKINAPTKPTKDNYNFEGWYLNDTKWDFENDIVTEDITLKAKWSKIEISNINEGNNKGSADDPFYIYDAETFVELLSEYGEKTKPVRQAVKEDVDGELKDVLDENGNIVYEDVEGETEPNHFKLLNDIDFSDFEYTTLFQNRTGFIGILNGDGYTIKNLSINVDLDNLSDFMYCNDTYPREFHAQIAIFGATSNAVIENISFDNININVDDEVINLFKDNRFQYIYIGQMKEFLVASIVGYADHTTISANVNAKINSNANSIYGVNPGANGVAGLVAYANYSNIISNDAESRLNINIEITCNNNYRGFYVGGLTSYLCKSTVSNVNLNINILTTTSIDENLSNNTLYIGGVTGFINTATIENININLDVKQIEEDRIDISDETTLNHALYNKIAGVSAIVRSNDNTQPTNITNAVIISNIDMDGIFAGVIYEVRSTKYTAAHVNQETDEDKETILITLTDVIIDTNVNVLQVFGYGYKLYYTNIIYTDNASKIEYTNSRNEKINFNLKMTGSTSFESNGPTASAYLISENSETNTIKISLADLYVVYKGNLGFNLIDSSRIERLVGKSVKYL